MPIETIANAFRQLGILHGSILAVIPAFVAWLVSYLALPRPLDAWLPSFAPAIVLVSLLLGILVVADREAKTAKRLQGLAFGLALVAIVVTIISTTLQVQQVTYPIVENATESVGVLVGRLNHVQGECAQLCREIVDAGERCTLNAVATLPVIDQSVSLQDCFGPEYRWIMLLVAALYVLTLVALGLAFGSLTRRDTTTVNVQPGPNGD